jgi:uncharacterized RDD family membrane protein YckC
MTAITELNFDNVRPTATLPVKFAGLWRRAMAASIDAVILIALIGGLTIAVQSQIDGGLTGSTIVNGQVKMPFHAATAPQVEVTRVGDTTTIVETRSGTQGFQSYRSIITTTYKDTGTTRQQTSQSTSVSSNPSPLAIAVYLAVWLLYASLFEASRLQATPGKLAMVIRVSDEHGNRLPVLRAIVRTALKLVSAALLFVGFLMAGRTKKKQALHDIIARATVSCTPA